MAIKAHEFDGRHWESRLPSITVIVGDEPYFKVKLGDQWRRCGRTQGFDERSVIDQSDSDFAARVATEMDALSLFSNQALVEIRLSKGRLDADTRKILLQWHRNPPPDKCLLITGPKLDASEHKSDWFSALDQQGVVIDAQGVPSYQFRRWLESTLSHQHLNLTPDAINIAVAHTEGNLLAVGQLIERLRMIQPDLLAGDILDVEQILDATTQSARYSVYDLVDRALDGDLSGVERIADILQAEGCEPMSVLFAMVRELDILLQIRYRIDQGDSPQQAIAGQRVWKSRERLVKGALHRLSLTRLRQLLTLCQETDRTIKGARSEPAWAMVKDVLIGLAGQSLRTVS